MYKHGIERVHVELTDKCNAECPGCFRSHYGGIVDSNIKNVQLDLNYFKLLGEDFIKSINYWLFCGTRGDPMSCTEIVDILEYIKSINNNAGVDVLTNGGMGSAKQFRRMSDILQGNESGFGRGSMTFSVDGWEDTNHIYRKNVKWDKVMRNILAYLEGPGLAQWDFLVFEHNVDDIPKVKEFCKEHDIQLKLKQPFGFANGPSHPNLDTMAVHSRKDGSYMYEIYPDTKTKHYDYNFYAKETTKNDFYNKNVIAKSAKYRTQLRTRTEGYDDMYSYYWLREHNNLDVDCHAIKSKELFIDCDGMFLPCCFLGGSWFAKDNQLRDMVGDESLLIPSETNSVEDILQSKFFNKTIPDGIEGNLKDPVGHCVKCVQTCGKWPDRSHFDTSGDWA